MADTDAVRGSGLPERLPADAPGAGSTEPAKVMTLVDHLFGEGRRDNFTD